MTKRNAFHSVRVLVAFVWIALFVYLVYTFFNPIDFFLKRRDQARKNDLTQIEKAIQVYYKSNGRYPPNPDAHTFVIMNAEAQGVNWGEAWTPYMKEVPKDPDFPRRSYLYISPDPNGQSYLLYASLERDADNALCNKGKVCANVPSGVLCGEMICNYGISSINITP